MQQLPENRAHCTGMWHETQQNKKNQLEDMTCEENSEESEPEEILQITQINKILPDNNDHYGVEIKINGKKPKVYH